MESLLFSNYKIAFRLLFAIILTLGSVLQDFALNPFTITVRATSDKCNGDSNGTATVNSMTGGTPPYTYNWTPSGQTSQTATGLSAGSYTVVVTDANGLTATDSAFIYQPPAIVLAIGADTLSHCGQLCVNFIGSSFTDFWFPVDKWDWNFGDGGTSTLQNPRHCYSIPGNYNVTLTGTANGCKAHLTISNFINVYSYPDAVFSINPQPTTISNSGTQFTDESTDQYGISSWTWNFYDSIQFSTEHNPFYLFKDTGRYCVKLRVSNIHGCEDSTINCLYISPPHDLWIPDAFSPNGDGQNDVLFVRCDCIKSMNLKIFDRWGNKVFETENVDQGWNGTYNGQPLNSGTYVYYIKATLYTNNVVEHKGNIELIR